MGEKIKLNLFTFEDEIKDNQHDLENLLNTIQDTAFEDRIRVYNFTDNRVETIQKESEYWLLDFGKLRYSNGPGKGSKTKPTVGFEFNKDEHFSEAVACLVNVEKKYLILQSNVHGTSPGGVQNYFNFYDPDQPLSLAFKPRYDSEKLAEFERRKNNTKIHLKVDKREFTSADRRGNNSLANALKSADGMGSPFLEVLFSKGQYSNTPLKKAESNRLISRIKNIMGDNPDAVKKFKVQFEPNLDEALQTFDLLLERVNIVFTDLPKGVDNRIPLEARFHALERINTKWSKYFK